MVTSVDFDLQKENGRLSPKEVELIFSNLENVYAFTKRLLKDIEKVYLFFSSRSCIQIVSSACLLRVLLFFYWFALTLVCTLTRQGAEKPISLCGRCVHPNGSYDEAVHAIRQQLRHLHRNTRGVPSAPGKRHRGFNASLVRILAVSPPPAVLPFSSRERPPLFRNDLSRLYT